jgi:murein DD-endopeptidase MepM/ murein hydrolase activator NlpD
MKKSILIISIFLSLLLTINGQNLKIIGKAEPGNILVGIAKNTSSVFLNDTRLAIDNNGTFVFGFDRDASGTHNLKVVYNDGKEEIKKIKLPKRKYQVQKLKMASKYVTPPMEELERIDQERELMKKARAEVGKIDSALFISGFIKPSEGRISSVFGSQRILNGVAGNPHNGIDIAADAGTPVYAASDGAVIIAGEDFYYNGNFVLLDHGQNLTSVYLHMSRLSVRTGDFVKKGQKIGEIGSTGRSTAPHLHWGVQWYKNRIDPMSLLNIKM